MTAFDRAVAVILRHEGGLVDHPNDPGGLTNFGIALNAHPELTREDILHMTWQQASEIYRKEYWAPIHADELPYPIALCVFDAAVNSGCRHAAQWLQRALQIPSDGKVGPLTIQAANDSEVPTVCEAFTDIRLDFLRGLPTWTTFGTGWQRRCRDTLHEALVA